MNKGSREPPPSFLTTTMTGQAQIEIVAEKPNPILSPLISSLPWAKIGRPIVGRMWTNSFYFFKSKKLKRK